MNPISSAQAQPGQLDLLFTAEVKREVRRVWSVYDLVREIRTHIEREYADCWVEGEISNLRAAPSGHLYFTLKDGDAQLPVVLFRRQALLLRFRPEDGLQVLVRGRASVYEQRGQMQLIAETLEPVGSGSLQLAFEQLKARLEAEGLFALERKRALPAYPRCVGIITSPAGAVIRDFLNITARRHAPLDVLLYPAAVQGETSAAEIAAGILYFNQLRPVDVIVVARGGGSLEDLAPFNSELLARAIARSGIPTVSAVGHETDFTIADFVADLRAPTPSAAAELITAALHKVEERIAELHLRLTRAARYRLIMAREGYSRLSPAAALARFHTAIGRRQQQADDLHFRLERAWRNYHTAERSALQEQTDRLLRQDVLRHLRAQSTRVHAAEGCVLRNFERNLQARNARLGTLAATLESLSPLRVLERGYALVFKEDGSLLRDAEQAQQDEIITTRLAHGTLQSRITGTNT